MLRHYILGGPEGRTPIPIDDFIEWARWFESSDDVRRVARTEDGNACVSTVFLGLDHQWGKGPPVLFETMVFYSGHPLDQEQERYSTWEEAEEGHREMVRRVTELAPHGASGRDERDYGHAYTRHEHTRY